MKEETSTPKDLCQLVLGQLYAHTVSIVSWVCEQTLGQNK